LVEICVAFEDLIDGCMMVGSESKWLKPEL
jgi:hypothetical protein